MNTIDLALFSARVTAICEEMGTLLRQSAFSPNIRDRLDFSCALFDAEGGLVAQAAHIPVHLGSMAFAMQGIVDTCVWEPEGMIVLNDPYLGGTHLPDVTVIAPVFVAGELTAFVVNRAHHASIGASTPGSMPMATSLEQEGVVMPPTPIVRDGKLCREVLARLAGEALPEGTDDAGVSDPRWGDFAAQVSANRAGVARLLASIPSRPYFQAATRALNAYGRRLAEATLSALPAGRYSASDVLDDDGAGREDIVIAVQIDITRSAVRVDFSGTAAQVPGNVNCPLSVAAAAVFYVFRCLMPPQTPACRGSFEPISLHAPEGCLVNAVRPAAVAAGNVETSSRMVDVILAALAQAIPDRIPAASQGSMNNLAMGAVACGDLPRWDYYETMGGGMGAHARGPGLSGVQTHMTNTLNTPVETLESHYPVQVERYAIRRGSGGRGRHCGGDGILRRYRFLRETQVTLLSERRRHAPWGLAGGCSGEVGINRLNDNVLPGKCSLVMQPGDVLEIATPGGGGYGEPDPVPDHDNARFPRMP